MDRNQDGNLYRIVSDPYHKWISIEHYMSGKLQGVVYDSRFLDFRHLKPLDQLGWRKEIAHDEENEVFAWIFNQDDRVILQERSFFERKLCFECRIMSLEGTLLAFHRMFYAGNFIGVMLFDAQSRPVMMRRYGGWKNGGFTDLKEEVWDMGLIPQWVSEAGSSAHKVSY